MVQKGNLLSEAGSLFMPEGRGSFLYLVLKAILLKKEETFTKTIRILIKGDVVRMLEILGALGNFFSSIAFARMEEKEENGAE